MKWKVLFWIACVLLGAAFLCAIIISGAWETLLLLLLLIGATGGIVVVGLALMWLYGKAYGG